jgi:hypothetical protein
MKPIDSKRYLSLAAIGLLWLATNVSAEERGSQPASRSGTEAQSESSIQARRWNLGLIYGATTFYGSEAHRTLGVTFRIRLTNRLSFAPELRYMDLPVSSFEGSRARIVDKHSDIMVAGHIIYDFRDETKARFVPYVMGSVARIETRNETTYTPIAVPGAVPIFPTPSPSQSTTNKTAASWLWIGGGVGLRIVLARGFFVSPEVSFGRGVASASDLSASAAVKVGYGF